MTNPQQEGPSCEPGPGFFLLKVCFCLANVACYVVRLWVFVKHLETFLIVTHGVVIKKELN